MFTHDSESIHSSSSRLRVCTHKENIAFSLTARPRRTLISHPGNHVVEVLKAEHRHGRRASGASRRAHLFATTCGFCSGRGHVAAAEVADAVKAEVVALEHVAIIAGGGGGGREGEPGSLGNVIDGRRQTPIDRCRWRRGAVQLTARNSQSAL